MKYFMNTRKWIDPADLKKKLGLQRDDPIPIACMSKVENIVNYQDPSPYAIFVSGDYQYDSTIKSQKQIHLILSKGHYSINKETIIKKQRQCYEEKTIVIVQCINNVFHMFDGEDITMITKQEYDDAKYKYLSNTKLIVDKNFTAESRKMENLEDAYHYYIELADELKKESNGLFNMYKCPAIKNMALNYFYDLT
jgi:hypothetical protein